MHRRVLFSRRPLLAASLALVAGTSLVSARFAVADGDHGDDNGKRVKPIVIGHRGASGYRPEHTLPR